MTKAKQKSPSKNQSGANKSDSKKRIDFQDMSMLDELRNDSVHSLTSNNRDEMLIDEVFGDENSAINEDDFGEPDEGFDEE